VVPVHCAIENREAVLRDDLVPAESQIYAWIQEVFAHGVRRPGYPADRWAEAWLQDQFRGCGLERVRAEPVSMPFWEPREASLVVTARGRSLDIPCFPLPLAAATPGFEAPLISFDRAEPQRVAGAVALYDAARMRVPHSWYASIATWTYDPENTFDGSFQVLPFAREIQDAMQPSMDAGAAAFVGVLTGDPADSKDYYVPYDAKHRPIPGVWISGSDGERLRAMLAEGAATARIIVDAVTETIECYNIVGELPGADDETVIVGSHHDGPWSSAVEDGSGIALVLAQAAYWSQVPEAERPHRMLFLLNSGHMAGGAGQRNFVETHRVDLDRCVLELHLEHAANEFARIDGDLRATGQPEARWWFTTRINRLESAVRGAIESEDLQRSYMLRPDVFGEKPTTDGADFHLAGVPLVNFLVAPYYLFDSSDTLDKIHRPTLVPLTRAGIRIIESTRGVSAAAMRADLVKAEG
jgi:hypothetical protein